MNILRKLGIIFEMPAPEDDVRRDERERLIEIALAVRAEYVRLAKENESGREDYESAINGIDEVLKRMKP